MLKMKPHKDTPPEALALIKEHKEQALAHMELLKIQAQALGVEVQHKIATWQKEIADGTRRPNLPNGEIDGRDGCQYLFENSSNSKNGAATIAMLMGNSDPEASSVNIAILGRMGNSGPVTVDDAEIVVEKVVED